MNKPHAVLVPLPCQGHINPLLKVAKLLHLKGFHITFVNTEYNHKRVLESKGGNSINGPKDFIFETIPDGVTPTNDEDDGSRDSDSLNKAILKNFINFFNELLARLHESAIAGLIPPVSCIVSDCFMPFTIQAAEEHSLPVVLFTPFSACTFLSTLFLAKMYKEGHLPLKDVSDESLEAEVDWIPGLKNFKLKDLPDVIKRTNPDDILIKFVIEIGNKCHKASGIVFNSSNALESDVMNTLNTMFPSLYTIGPLSSILNQGPKNHLASLDSNLWKEDSTCLEWLDSKESKSVIFINFGSIINLSHEEVLEVAWGLANSKKNFLWIMRPDQLEIGSSVVFSSEFVNETSERGLIASWCPQEKVLNHPSVGGFLTHCGWNSTTESICAGVPMLCWSFTGDTPTNCRYICDVLNIGIEIDKNAIKRDVLENLVNELMVGEKGKKMREKVLELKSKVDKDTEPGGSSYTNLDKLINEVLLKQK